MQSRVFWSVVVVCVFLPGESRAQDTGPLGIFHNYGYPYGPRVAPAWSYPLLTGGPFITYPTPPVSPPGLFGYGLITHPRHDDTSPPGGVGLCRPAVPVYGPIPATFGDDPLVKQWRSALRPRLVPYGWVGPYAASPRPKYVSVHVWPGTGSVSGAPGEPAARAGGCLTLAVKVPHPTAEVRVDGKPTTQTGTDRTFESPPLETGQSYAYTVTARWVDRGQVVEMTKAVTGAPGEVVRVDFGTPVVATGK